MTRTRLKEIRVGVLVITVKFAGNEHDPFDEWSSQ